MSSSSDDGSDHTDEILKTTRDKRLVLSCSGSTNKTPNIIWPPPSTSKNWPNLNHVNFVNPKFGTKLQLYSKTGCFLAIYHSHGVRGTRDENDLHTLLEIINAGYPGHVRIKGTATNAFVGINSHGRLYTEIEEKEEATVFIESLQGSYNTYLSCKYAYLGWYIGLKKSGTPKIGQKTKFGQKSIMFLPTRHKIKNMNFGSDDGGFGTKMKLFSETGYNLAIRYHGTVEGTQDENDTDCCLQMISAGPGLVQIKGLESDLCICFSDDGELYGEQEETNEATIFHENFQGSYSAYKSKKYPDWYIGINKMGQAKRGHKTRYGQRAVKFLPRRINC